MKPGTLIFSLVMSCVLIHNPLQSQIPNSSFEQWEHQNLGYHPEEWQTFDGFVHFASADRGIIRSEDSESGTYAMRMEASIFEQEHEGHVAFLGIIPGGTGDPLPLSENPDGVTINYKSEISDNEQSLIMFFFYDENSQVIMAEEVHLNATGGEYEEVIAAFEGLSQPGMPDAAGYSVMINTHESDEIVNADDYLTLDNISFNGTTDEIPNGNFEDWWEVTFDDPEGWYTSNTLSAFNETASASITSDAHTGSQAIELASFVIFEEAPDAGSDIFSFAITGDFNPFISEAPAPAFEVSDDETPEVSGYYKFDPGDNGFVEAMVGIIVYDNETVVEEDRFRLDPAEEYTPFTLEMEVPDGASFNMATVGLIMEGNNTDAEFLVDDLQWGDSETNSIDLLAGLKNNAIHTYPNPVQDTWTVEVASPDAEGTIRIHDVQGQLAKEVPIKAGTETTTLDVSNLENGIYIYSISAGDYEQNGRLIKE